MRVLVVLKLVCRHVKTTTVNFTQAQVPGADQEITFGKAHGSGAITTTTTLVKHQFTVFFPKLVDNRPGFFRD